MNLKPIKIPDVIEEVKPKKSNGFIWGLLLGMCLELIIMGAIIYPSYPDIWWASTHKNEMKWVIERYDTIQKASHVLFFEDKMEGVTIVKPQVSTFKGE
jgi:hypothetical protein